MRVLVAFIFAMPLVTACKLKLTEKAEAGPQVEYLFYHDGCRVYSFYDHGDYHYFWRCKE